MTLIRVIAVAVVLLTRVAGAAGADERTLRARSLSSPRSRGRLADLTAGRRRAMEGAKSPWPS